MPINQNMRNNLKLDKFNIIENHISSIDNDLIIQNIRNYIENYLKSDILIFNYDYINQAMWFNLINDQKIIEYIEILVKEYLIERRNIIRSFIKNKRFGLENLNIFLDNYIIKIEFINTITNFNEELISKNNILLSNLIISDSIIILYIESQLQIFEKSNLVKIFLEKVNYLSKYDNYNMYNKLILIFSNVFRQHLPQNEYPLPKNIKSLQLFSDLVKYYENIKNHYNFLDFHKLTEKILNEIIDKFINIISDNSNIMKLSEINIMFQHIHKELNSIFFINESKIEILINSIINFLNKHFTDKNIDIKNIRYILKFIYSINNKKYKSKFIILFDNEYTIDIIINFLDCIIKEKHSICEINKIINFIINIKNKELFCSLYYQYLVKRILLNLSQTFPTKEEYNTYILYEKDIYNLLHNCFNKNLTYKIKRVICDVLHSYDNIESMDNLFPILITSYNCWDLNYEGIVNYNMLDKMKHTFLGNYLLNNSINYSNLNPDKVLNWLLHYGEVNITYLNQNIKMLPIQFMIIELFNDTDIVDISSIHFLDNYTENFKNDLIKSLVLSKIFKKNNSNLILQSSGIFESDLIKLFYNNININTISNDLVHSKEDIIKTNINHILKIQNLNYKDLFNIIKKKIVLFDIDTILFDKSLEYMINMDYIKINNDKYEKIYY
jgi:hypothetical protein